MIINPGNLNEAYDAYVKNQIMRKDMFRCIVDACNAMDERLKAIEAGESNRKAASLEFVTRLGQVEAHIANLDDEIDTKVATAANSAVNILASMQNGGTAATPARRGPGRPPKHAPAEEGA